MELLFLVFLVAVLVWQRRMSGRIARLEADVAGLRASAHGQPAAMMADTIHPATLRAQIDRDAATAEPADIEQIQTPDIRNARQSIDIEPPGNPDYASKEGRAETFESWLGARWAVWVGGLALALGGIFLVKYSIESGLLSPAVRLTLAALFGLALMGAGEAVRRKIMPGIEAAYRNAMIPGVLTAAGAMALFGVIYAAHGIYGFIGPAGAFILLGVTALATLGLSLTHGQALAGLGLFGSMATPALVAGTAPDIRALFVFLSVSWLATVAAARMRHWTVVPALSNAGIGLWCVFYLSDATPASLIAPVFALLTMIAGTIFIWPGRHYVARHDTQPKVQATNGTAPPGKRRRLLPALFRHPPLAITLSVSLATLFSALGMLLLPASTTTHPAVAYAAVIAAFAALGASRAYTAWPAVAASFGAIAGVFIIAQQRIAGTTGGYGIEIALGLLLGAIFVLLGLFVMKDRRRDQPHFACLWAVAMTAVPVAICLIGFVEYGNLSRDWIHGLYALAIGLVFAAGAEWVSRQSIDGDSAWPLNILAGGSFAAFALAMHSLTSGLATTLLLPLTGFGYVAATRIRPWDALPWMMAAAGAITLVRIGWDPTLVGPSALGTTPFFNALLPGYGIPAVLTILAAYELSDWPDARVRHVLQAMASILGLLTIAILVRHAMNGGVLDDAVPTLGEQSIYTLLFIGLSGVLLMLDMRAPGPVFRYGSMIAGILAVLDVFGAHFIALNPYFSGENTGRWPFVNLLLIGYLLPGLAYAGLAFLARDRRPAPYVMLLASTGAMLTFVWATLSVRRFWQGENIADWKGFMPGETYSYSVVWLLIGIALLFLGSRFDARSLRLTSAALVLIAVVKVFLIDMSNLEGILRALSFIGLGIVLIGIGLFYQKILTGRSLSKSRRV